MYGNLHGKHISWRFLFAANEEIKKNHIHSDLSLRETWSIINDYKRNSEYNIHQQSTFKTQKDLKI
jgi:hypothetical protein